MNGIESLNAGAPDLRLSGDQTQRGSYVQRRRAQMAGGGIMGSNAGSMLVAPTADGSRPGYGWNPLDWIPNEIKDPIAKLIPNEIKDPKVAIPLALTAANYLPTMLPGGSDQTLIQQAIQKGINPMNLVRDGEPIGVEEGISSGVFDSPSEFGDKPITIRYPIDMPVDAPRGFGEKVGDFAGVLGQGIGDLVGGAGNIATKIGQTIIPGGETGYGDLYGGATNVLGGAGDVARKALATILPGGDPGYVPGGLYKTAGQALMSPVNAAVNTTGNILTGGGFNPADRHPENIDTSKDLGFWREALATVLPGGDPGFVPGGLYKTGLGTLASGIGAIGSELLRPGTKDKAQWLAPLLGGLAAGKYQSDWLKDQPAFPKDETGIKFQTAQEAMADPKLRFKPEAQYANVAEGGRIGYQTGKKVEKDMFIAFSEYKTDGGRKNFSSWFSDIWVPGTQVGMTAIPKAVSAPSGEIPGGFRRSVPGQDTIGIEYPSTPAGVFEELKGTGFGAAEGGRIGYKNAGDVEIPKEFLEELKRRDLHKFLDKYRRFQEDYKRRRDLAPTQEVAQGGRIGAQEGGLMNLGGMEKDYRQEGGFVPIGGQEKADDVPARLSKNEFVFTADAVRAAGGGDIDAGAEVMENVMNNLEAGGKVSEESQGLEGARGMFANAQQLEKRII